MNDTDEDSSDSSNDFAVITPKDELTASFFSIQSKKPSHTTVNSKDNDDDDDSSDDNFTNVPEHNHIDLFTEVIKNLQASQINYQDNPKQGSSKNDNSLTHKRITNNVNNISDEINAVLLQGESKVLAHYENEEDTDDEEEDAKAPAEYTIPKEGVKITLPSTSLVFRKKPNSKKESDLAAILRKRLRANQILVEKVSRLCWLAHGFHLNRQANNSDIMATAVSLISTKNYPKDNFDLMYLTKFTKWFRNIFTVEPDDSEVISINKETLLKRLAERKIYDYKELVVLYVAILRGIGLNCRLVISLNPPSARVYNDLLPKTSTSKKDDDIKKKGKRTETRTKSSKKDADDRNMKKTESTVIKNNEEARQNAKVEARKKAAAILRTKYSGDKKNRDKTNDNTPAQNNITESKDTKSAGTDNVPSSRRLRSSKSRTSSTSTVNRQQSNAQTTLEDNQSKARASKKRLKNNSSDSSSEEEEAEESSSKGKKRRNNNGKKRTIVNSKVKDEEKDEILSDKEETDSKNGIKKSQNVWAEVYVESKESWICVNVIDTNVDCVAEVYKKASSPVLYVIAWNTEGLIKDVTRRYCPHWLSVTRKQRIDEKWWIATLRYWPETETTMSRKEDEMLLQKELEQPLPKTVGECKGHPLYVLVRHLLKYEALYPPDCVPLGHLRTGEAIYSRYCVHTLCSRETWLKKARVVKPKQDAYKIVKALPKYDKLSGVRLKDSVLEIFGEWQTTEYVPPVAKDGIVPRNEYGNVDLFKQCMLPKGTVHINLPGLNRIARKLNIDCATAVVGFNFGCMGAVPAIEGYVVCSEYEDTLREAWEAEQIEAARRATEKREKRIYGNWKKLIRGLLIKEKLSQKYQFLAEQKTTLSNKRPRQRKETVKKSKT